MGRNRPTLNRIDPVRMIKEADAFRTISEAAEALGVPQHVLRFWELKFPQINPLKRGGGRRYYRPEEISLLASIRDLLYADGYTIKGVQRLLRQHGVRAVLGMAARLTPPDDQRRSERLPDEASEEGVSMTQTPGADKETESPAEAFRLRIDALAAELDDCAAILVAATLAAN